MVLDLDMLSSLMEDRVSGQCQGTLVVHLELDHLGLLTKHLTQ
jgi:hypothetical protein